MVWVDLFLLPVKDSRVGLMGLGPSLFGLKLMLWSEKKKKENCARERVKKNKGFFLVVRHMQEKIKLRGGVLGATTTESCIIIFKVIRILGVFFVIFVERRYYYTWCASQVRHKLKIYYNWLYNSRFV